MRGKPLTDEERRQRAEGRDPSWSPTTYALAGRPESEALPHGWTKYSNEGCKCAICRAAWSEYQKNLRRVRARRIAEDPSLAEHGKPATYHNWGCKCRPCKDAWAAASRSRKRRENESGVAV